MRDLLDLVSHDSDTLTWCNPQLTSLRIACKTSKGRSRSCNGPVLSAGCLSEGLVLVCW